MEIGDLIEDRYRIERLLGRGGSGSVYLARNLRSEKLWAIKEIRPEGELADGERLSIEQSEEIRFMKNLHHPSLPEIVDAAVVSGRILLVMDYIEGDNLKEILKKRGSFPAEEVIRIGTTICDCLTYLHTRTPPRYHRDIKPANILLTKKGRIYLVDFGAGSSEGDDSSVSFGTPAYAAPEQFGRGRIDARTDCYSLARTLLALLDEKDADAIRLRSVLLRASSFEPEKRYESAEDLKRALLAASDRMREKQKKKRRRTALGFAAAALACVLLIAGLAGRAHTGRRIEQKKVSAYEHAIRLAEQQGTLDEALDYYREAITIDPAGEESYDSLTRMVGRYAASEGDFTEEMSIFLMNLMNEVDESGRDRWEILQEENPGICDRMLFQIGLWSYYLGNTGPTECENAVNRYLAKVQGSEWLSEEEQILVDSMVTRTRLQSAVNQNGMMFLLPDYEPVELPEYEIEEVFDDLLDSLQKVKDKDPVKPYLCLETSLLFIGNVELLAYQGIDPQVTARQLKILNREIMNTIRNLEKGGLADQLTEMLVTVEVISLSVSME